MPTYTLFGGEIDEEEAAAALSAVVCLLEEEAAAASASLPAGRGIGWHETAKLVTQGIIPTRVPIAPRWSSIERLRRAGRGSSGIVGQ
ncbi:MAG: hypothetical protein HGA45_17230 [Chloroflexales bacterium]|nr:hypothetical protein [Chloroflexales bacterium]